MKILLVSYYFPPTNAIGAVRIGKLAKYLLAQGHDVRVLTAAEPFLPVVLGLLVLGAWILSFFGPDFPAGNAALVILIAGTW